jgi:type VI secretion system ImpH/TssG family protein
VRDRTENHNDSTLADFLDLFHHRYLTHMYRAWAQSQAAAGLDRAEDEVFSGYIARLTGHDPLEIRDSVLPAHARLAASTHLGREARNPDGLAATLARFFAVPVQLQEFVLHWIRIDEEDQSHLGQARTSSVMGVGAIAGEVVADRQNKFRLVLGPLSLDQYLRFTPQGRDLPLLVEWVRGFVGYEFVWEVELRVRNDSTPPPGSKTPKSSAGRPGLAARRGRVAWQQRPYRFPWPQLHRRNGVRARAIHRFALPQSRLSCLLKFHSHIHDLHRHLCFSFNSDRSRFLCATRCAE